MRTLTVLAIALALASCSSRRTAAKTPPAPQVPVTVVSGPANTIPVGTKLLVRTNEAISSSKGEGKTYNGQMEIDVAERDGKILLPKGSPVELVVMQTTEKKGVKGAGLQLGMRSVTVNGQTYLVISEELNRTTGLGRNTETAQKVGAGAALGTVIGAAAGGGKGAVIGGLAGAAAGALAQILTAGKEMKIPAESVLEFRLDEPMILQPVKAAP